jgi:hypothetical protein
MGKLFTLTSTATAGLALSVLVWWALASGVADLYGGLGDALFSILR